MNNNIEKRNDIIMIIILVIIVILLGFAVYKTYNNKKEININNLDNFDSIHLDDTYRNKGIIKCNNNIDNYYSNISDFDTCAFNFTINNSDHSVSFTIDNNKLKDTNSELYNYFINDNKENIFKDNTKYAIKGFDSDIDKVYVGYNRYVYFVMNDLSIKYMPLVSICNSNLIDDNNTITYSLDSSNSEILNSNKKKVIGFYSSDVFGKDITNDTNSNIYKNYKANIIVYDDNTFDELPVAYQCNM